MTTGSKPERVARILVERHFSVAKNLVKYNAFMPALWNGVWSTSVFDADGLLDGELWVLGASHVAAERGKPVYGHADVSTEVVERTGLLVERTESPPRHCNIVAWPAAKEDRISVAHDIAAESILKLKPE